MIHQTSQLISSERCADFRRDGFLRIDDVIAAEEMQQLRGIYEDCFSRDDIDRSSLGGVDKGRDVLPQVHGPSKEYGELLQMDFHQRLLDCARQLLGPEATFRNDHMIRKPAGYGAVTPWHQDQAYHRPDQRFRNVNFWMPLDDADEHNGCLHFVPGSHGGTVLPHRRIATPGGHALEALGADYWDANGVAMPCPAGSVTAHHSYLLHYAGCNRSRQDRCAYIQVFVCPAEDLTRPLSFNWESKR